jgi:hypothetical protein
LADDGAVPTFGLWYDFRQRPPLDDYARFYDECFEEIEESERLGFAGVWLSEHHFVDDGYLPSPLIVAAALAARTERITVGTNVLLLPMHTVPSSKYRPTPSDPMRRTFARFALTPIPSESATPPCCLAVNFDPQSRFIGSNCLFPRSPP